MVDNRTIEEKRQNLIGLIENFGYHVVALPIAAHEYEYNLWLAATINKIEAEADSLRKSFGYRGKSKSLLAALHQSLPIPDWGIELAS